MNIYGLLGRNISYSFSKKYFSEKFKKEKINSTYVNFDIPQIGLLKEVLQTKGLKGFNVTIPYKEEIFSFLDKVDPVAKEIGAVNVVKVGDDKKLMGYNSDHYGFSQSLLPLLHSGMDKALILGTGGASKAIAYALRELGINYGYVSRNPDLNEYGYSDLDEEIIDKHKLIINCTPLGTFPDIQRHPDIPYQFVGRKHILYDLIYNPDETTFMKKGKEKGAVVSNGLQMLILQAEKAWKIWNT